jgi:riboflavin biosynthesis pyrimidine reductase
MKPHVVMHMGISIDGRIVPSSWPKPMAAEMGEIYERIHRELAGDAWIVGRVTMAEFAKGDPRPIQANETYLRTTWKAPGAANGPYAVALDASGKLHLNIDRVNGDPLVAMLTEAVSDHHLAELRRDGISYVFAGEERIDLALALERLEQDFGIRRLLLEGGGGINGSFLSEGLIDEVSLIVAPIADGGDGPTLFRGEAPEARSMTLESVDRLENDFLHLRYRVRL